MPVLCKRDLWFGYERKYKFHSNDKLYFTSFATMYWIVRAAGGQVIAKIKDDNYLVDVGFGDFLFYPVKIELNKETSDPAGIFRIETFDENYKIIKKKNAEGVFIPEYIFSEQERQLEEFYARCNYHQTINESHFMQKKICSLPVKSGRITLAGDILKITENGKVKERKLNNEQEIRQELWNCFGIKL